MHTQLMKGFENLQKLFLRLWSNEMEALASKNTGI